MNNLKRLFAGLCAMAMLCSCAQNIENGDISVTTPPPEVTETPTIANTPWYTVSKDSQQQVTTPSVSVSTEPSVTQTPTMPPEPVTSHEITEPTVVTNEQGEIVDTYEPIVFDTEDPAELYQKFGLSQSERNEYYQEISNECEFPIIHVSTENEKEVLSLENYVNCLVEIFNCDEKYVMPATSAGIRVRGNASAHYGNVDDIREEGAPYRIKFTSKQSVLGLNDNARCKSWVLLRTYKGAIRDDLALKLGKAINEGNYYVSDTQYVQLYINEEYMGFYLLCEQTQENPNRVAINECEVGYTGTDIGYLVELDNYAHSEEWNFTLLYNKEPITDVYGETRVPRKYYYSVKNDIYSDEQLKFIERYMEVCYEIPMRAIQKGEYYRLNEDLTLTLAQDEFASAEECIRQVLDIESFVDMYILFEIANDQDLGGGSFYFAVDFGSVSQYKTLTCVAPWDFDWGYTDYNSKADGGLYAARFKDDYFVENWGDRTNVWLVLMYSADWFREMVRERWNERYDAILETVDSERKLVSAYVSDFNKQDSATVRRANAVMDWVDDRIDYLNSLWGLR